MIPRSFHLPIVSAVASGVLFAASPAARADDTWTGQGGDSNWSTSGNWSGGVPQNTYGVLYFNDTNNGKTTNTDDISSMAQNGLKWYDSSTWTINTSSPSNVINLYDNGGTQSEVENFSTGSVTINVPIVFAANNSRSGSSSHPFGQIDAVNGDMTFGSTGTLTVGGPGSTVDGIRMFGGTGRTTTFNDTVNASNGTNGGVGDKYFALIGPAPNGTGTGTNVTVGGTFNSGDIYLMDGSTLNLASGGTINTTALRLGGDFSATGYQDLTRGGTFNLAATSGGQTFASIINTVSGNTSGALLINSQNTSGTNTISGNVYLDSPLTVNIAAAGGTLSVTSSTVDVKAWTLTLRGAGVLNFANGIQSYSGGGTVNYNGSGTLLLNGSGNNTGATNINSGTLGGVGTLSGPVNVAAGATIHPADIDVNRAPIIGTLSTGALTLASGSTSVFDLATSTSYDQIVSSGAISLAGTLQINNSATYVSGTVFDLEHGTSLTGVYNGIANNGIYTFGSQMFQAEYTGTDFELVAVPEPRTVLGGLLCAGVLGYRSRRRLAGLLRRLGQRPGFA